MRDLALRLERTYVYPRPIHRLHNSIALSDAAEANVLVREFIIHPRDQTIPFKHEDSQNILCLVSYLAPSARLALSTGCLLAVSLSKFRPTYIVLLAALC
jgi:hypothetical protein